MADVVKLRNELLGISVGNNLTRRGFEACYCASREEALKKALELIPDGDLVGWGGSVTVEETGLLEAVKAKYPCLDRDKAASMEERMELMRKALLCDTFLMSSNAISEDGQLVNIDGNGNRCAARIYGPRQVLVIAGVNKIRKTLQEAIARARTTAAPLNVQRFPGLEIPCRKTGVCCDCQAADSVCAQFVITRRCRPAGRIKVILVGEDLGF